MTCVTAIEQRNAERDVWGWKYPHAAHYLPALSGVIRNPYYVVVYRDPVAAALSQLRRDAEARRRTSRMALHESNNIVNANTGFVLATGRPSMLVSYERASSDPGALIAEVAEFLGVPKPGEELTARIIDYVSPGQYKGFSEHFGEITA